MNSKFATILCIASTVLLLPWPIATAAATASNSTVDVPVMQTAPFKVGEPFLRARARLIKLGWKPIRMHENDDYEYSGIEKELARRKFLEIDGCSVDAGVLCIFYYRKLTKCLRVDTIGEDIAQLTVTRWTAECPKMNQ